MPASYPNRQLLVLAVSLALAGAHEAQAADPAAAPAAQSESEGISSERYVTAGLVGTFVGYGLGHVIAYEWTSFGWVCTAGELTPLLVGAATGSFRLTNEPRSHYVVPVVLLLSAVAFRVVEVVDIWSRPRVRDDAALSTPQGGWAALPLPSRHGARMLFVGSF